jgi:hypothetical protein
LRDHDLFPYQKLILSNIELLVHQDIQRKVIELELIEYMYKAGKMNSKGQYITDFSDSENIKKVRFGIDILDTRLVVSVNNTWKDTEVYSVSLGNEYVRTKTNILSKYKSKGSVVVDRFRPHRLEALVFSLELTIKV